MNKTFSLAFILILAASSFMTVQTVFAQTPTPSPVPLPTPSVPEFTLKYAVHSYDVATTYSRNPYTGQNITTAGYTVYSMSITVTIQNEPNAVFYDLEYKPHFSTTWSEAGVADNNQYAPSYLSASSSQYTVITFQGNYTGGNSVDFTSSSLNDGWMVTFPINGQVDFRVEAMDGGITQSSPFSGFPYQIFNGEVSGWSQAQTITISVTSNPIPTPTNTIATPTATLTVPEFSWFAILPLFLFLLSVALVLKDRYRKTSKRLGKLFYL